MQPDAIMTKRWWDLPAALILIVAVFLTSVRLNATNWTDELTVIQTITVLGVISGLALGQSLFSSRASAWYSAIYGSFVIFWQIGVIFGEGILWTERLSSIFGRLGFSLENLLRERAVTDPIMFLFMMGILFWMLSSHAGYTLTRYANAWRASLPMGLALFIIHIHDPFWTSRSWYLAGYVFLALILLARINFLRKQDQWRASRTHMPPFIGLDFLRTTITIGALLILVAWTAPALASNLPPAQEAWERISRPWYEARAKMTNAFASLRATVGVSQEYYGDVLPLGRGNTLTDIVIFSVEAPPRPTTGVRYYWRARSYETWTGTSWQANPSDSNRFHPEEPDLIFPNLSGRWEADFTFNVQTTLSTLYVAPQPQWVSRPAVAEILQSPEGTVDILRLSTSPSLRAGEVYHVRSSLTNVTLNELRDAGTEYPEYITDRYLQIPNTVTRRTRELAQEITAPYDNPYDQVEAVTQWLRENITYVDNMPVPPQNRDIIDWLLFDLKQGFCNYYATAEIVMLRSLGIPARLGVGYAQGQRDSDSNAYIVRQQDAHAWPEVFFPGIGWVEFEPTINQRPLQRPVGDAIDNEDGNSSGFVDSSGLNVEEANLEALLGAERLEDQPILGDEESAEDGEQTLAALNWFWLLLAGIVLLGFAVFTWYRSRILNPIKPMTPLSVQVEKRIKKYGFKPPAFIIRMSRTADQPLEARAYEQINRSLTHLGNKPQISDTPAERARLLKVLLPGSESPIENLLSAYQQKIYATNGYEPQNRRVVAMQASKDLRKQTWAAIIKKLFSRFQEPEKREPII